jgi:acyl carrier protein
MTTIDIYNKVFINTLAVTEVELAYLTYQSVPAWDSVGHMGLITALEEAFDIMIDTDDMIDFSSYEIGKVILKKYDVEL